MTSPPSKLAFIGLGWAGLGWAGLGWAEAEATHGSEAAHCLAAQMLDRKNNFILHEHLGDQP